MYMVTMSHLVGKEAHNIVWQCLVLYVVLAQQWSLLVCWSHRHSLLFLKSLHFSYPYIKKSVYFFIGMPCHIAFPWYWTDLNSERGNPMQINCQCKQAYQHIIVTPSIRKTIQLVLLQRDSVEEVHYRGGLWLLVES